MSYILDALKKSDQERKQGDVPDLQTVHIPVAIESTPLRWPYIVIVLLMLSLAFVLGMLKPWQARPVAQIDSAPVNKVETQKLRTNPQRVDRDVSPAFESKSQSVQPVYQQSMLEDSTLQESVVVKAGPSLDIDSVPHLYDMPSLVQESVPDMSFAGHVFSSQIDQRSVIINDRYMNEGDVVLDGLKIEQITQTGIVFNYNGQLFRMDILQDWSFD